MFWADKVAKEIIDSGSYKPYWVDDMKTPSGYPAISGLKGPLLHDLIYKALIHAGVAAKTTFIINDFDPIDGLSADLEEQFSKYLGFPLKTAPSPGEGADNFADFFANDYKDVLRSLGVEAEFLSSWEMYKEGKFDEVIREALDNREEILDVYAEVSGSQKREAGWYPLQVICENCGKLGTTKVIDWDGELVTYRCEENMVKWAQGCGNEGKISPFGGNGKLPWKVDWPAHWKVLGITIEGAGKDHASAGGSRDTARELCKRVFNYPEPFHLPYEFILIGGKKMSTSKGRGIKARESTNLLPAELIRFLFSRTDYRQQVNFDPMQTMAIPDLFDDYDKSFLAYIEGSDENLSRAFELSQVKELPVKEKTFIPRFRDVVNYMQQPGDIVEKYEKIKGEPLTDYEKQLLLERIKYAKIWVEKYAPEEFKMGFSQELSEQAKNLDDEQKKYLAALIPLIESGTDADQLQNDVYQLSKDLEINAKKAFASIYIVTIGKEHGPRAGAFLMEQNKEELIARIKEAIE